MYQRNDSDADARGSRILVKDLATEASLGRSASEWKTIVSGSAPMFNINSPESWEPNINQYSREPEFIETDFTSPLTEIARPLSLDANEVLKSEAQSNANKRPYSANQISEQTLMGRSMISLNHYNTTYQENTKLSYNTYFSKTHNCTDPAPILVKTSAFNNSSDAKAIFSQRSSLPQCTFTAQNYISKFSSLLPSSSQNKMTKPAFITAGSESYLNVVSHKKRVENSALSLIKASKSAHFTECSTYIPISNVSQESITSRSSLSSSPLNLSKNNEHFQISTRVENDLLRRQVDETNCEFSSPLNLIFKKEELSVPADMSLQSTFTEKGEKPERLSSLEPCTSYPFYLTEIKSKDLHTPPKYLKKSSLPEIVLRTDIQGNNPVVTDEETSQTDMPLSQSMNASSSIDASIKDELASCKSMPDVEDGLQESDENKFIWDDYLEHCSANAAPSALFKHVECSLQNGLKKGMLVEVANRVPEGTYWVASIIMSCGQLLMLRPACCQNGVSLDFWCDMSNRELHPLGWSDDHHKKICPPKDIADKVVSNWELLLKESLATAITPSQSMLDQKSGLLPFDQIHIEMVYEVQHEMDPDKLWYARVVENVGGRLSLQYEGSREAFWLFYTSHRLHPPGFSLENNKTLSPPIEIVKGKSVSEWNDLACRCKEEAVTNCPPLEVFKDQEPIENHNAQVGWRMELLDTTTWTFRIAHISKIINEFYFIVEPDDLLQPIESERKCCCHKNSLIIFPVGWHKDHNLTLHPVPGYDFDWSVYLEKMSFKAAPPEFFAQASTMLNDFKKGMKLEATDARSPDEICAATIEDIKGPLFWIKLDHDPSFVMIVPHDSHEIFPIGWCESNNYQLKTPLYKSLSDVNITLQEDIINSGTQTSFVPAKKSSGWCPKIYFNTKCYSGPFMSKWRIRNLPKSVGPGSVVSVMTTVLTKLIASGYKSSRVLRELQLEGPPSPGMHQQIMKTKYDMKNYSATVEICTSASQVEQFCRDVCRRLICCPNLISAHLYPNLCPENCLKIAKSKHYFHFGERRRQVGRPRGGHSNIEHFASEEQTSSHKRKKYKKKHLLTIRKKHGSSSAPTRSGSSEAEASSSEAVEALSPTSAQVNGLEKSESKEVATVMQQNVNIDPRPSEPVTKLRIICNKEKEDGNKSYIICNNSKDDALQVENASRKRKQDEKYNAEDAKRQKEITRKYEVQTRGISLTKNYSFEKKTHKKIFIIPPTPPVNQDSLANPLIQSGQYSELDSEKPNPGDSVKPLKLTSNPAEWSVQQVTDFIKMTDCSKLSKTIREQEIDGKSLLLLTLPTVQEFIEPKLGPAVKLCDLIERLKHAFFSQYANAITI